MAVFKEIKKSGFWGGGFFHFNQTWLKFLIYNYGKDYFEIFVPFSKTDISGKGEYVFVPNRDSSKNPHKLLSLYLHFMNFEQNDFYLFPPLELEKAREKMDTFV